MKTHSSNYHNTFISVAKDCNLHTAQAPPQKLPKTQAQMQYEMLIYNPYVYTSDDVLYETQGKVKGISRADFFAKARACMRASALPKHYGWGLHYNEAGKIALYAMESEAYKRLQTDSSIQQLFAMRSGKG